ncbi:uncharacterized protein [Oscarella lobularis]|uniref:uncharacterized protein isoform X3 n=1 Tax=Oscarella lobularis TaxID=121494 RepID=UPI00331417D6
MADAIWLSEEIASRLANFVAKGSLLKNLMLKGFVTTSQREEIERFAQENCEKAAIKLLSYLRDRQQPGTFDDFCDVLKETDGCQDLYRFIFRRRSDHILCLLEGYKKICCPISDGANDRFVAMRRANDTFVSKLLELSSDLGIAANVSNLCENRLILIALFFVALLTVILIAIGSFFALRPFRLWLGKRWCQRLHEAFGSFPPRYGEGVISKLLLFDWEEVKWWGKALFSDRIGHDIKTLRRQVAKFSEVSSKGESVPVAVLQDLMERVESIRQLLSFIPELEFEFKRESNDVLQNVCVLVSGQKPNEPPGSVHSAPIEKLDSTDDSILLKMKEQNVHLRRTATVSKLVDELGSRLVLPSHLISLDIPPGALARGKRQKITLSLFLSDHSVWVEGKKAFLWLLALSPNLTFRKFVSFQCPHSFDFSELSGTRISLLYRSNSPSLYSLVGELTHEARVSVFSDAVVSLSSDHITYHTKSFSDHLSIATGPFIVTVQSYVSKNFVPAKRKTLAVKLVFSCSCLEVLHRIRKCMEETRESLEKRSGDQFSCCAETHSCFEVSLSSIENNFWTPVGVDTITISGEDLRKTLDHSNGALNHWITETFILECVNTPREHGIALECNSLRRDPNGEVKETPHTVCVSLEPSGSTNWWSIAVGIFSSVIGLFGVIFVGVWSLWMIVTPYTVRVSLEPSGSTNWWSIVAPVGIFSSVSGLFGVIFGFWMLVVKPIKLFLAPNTKRKSSIRNPPLFIVLVLDELPKEVNPALTRVVARLIGAKWEELVIVLGGNSNDVEQYRQNSRKNFNRAMETIESWEKANRSHVATAEALIAACEKCGIHKEKIIVAYKKEVECP